MQILSNMDKNIQAKLMKFCTYQDRCIKEITDKLFKLEVWREDHDVYINFLIDHQFLDDQRFAASFVRGKFRIKRWGKLKIKNHLQQKGIANSFIESAIREQIDEEKYKFTAIQLLENKSNTLKEKDPYKRKQKLLNHLLQKGFESELILSLINQLEKNWQ